MTKSPACNLVIKLCERLGWGSVPMRPVEVDALCAAQLLSSSFIAGVGGDAVASNAVAGRVVVGAVVKYLLRLG